MRTFNYFVDETKSSSVIAFFETLRILTQYKDKKVTDYSESEFLNGVEVEGYSFKIKPRTNSKLNFI